MCKPAVVPVIAVPHPFSALIWQITKSNLIKATKGLRNSSGKIMEVPNLIGTWTGSWFRIPNIPNTTTPHPPRIFRGMWASKRHSLWACVNCLHKAPAMSVSGFQSCANIRITKSFEGCIHNPGQPKVWWCWFGILERQKLSTAVPFFCAPKTLAADYDFDSILLPEWKKVGGNGKRGSGDNALCAA